MIALFASESTADTLPGGCIEAGPAGVSCGDLPRESVSAVRHIGIRELQLHLSSCHYLASLASARYRGSENPVDAQEAQRWAVLEQEAQKAVLTLRREQFDADELTMAGEWTEGVCAHKQQENA